MCVYAHIYYIYYILYIVRIYIYYIIHMCGCVCERRLKGRLFRVPPGSLLGLILGRIDRGIRLSLDMFPLYSKLVSAAGRAGDRKKLSMSRLAVYYYYDVTIIESRTWKIFGENRTNEKMRTRCVYRGIIIL